MNKSKKLIVRMILMVMLSFSITSTIESSAIMLTAEAAVKAPSVKVSKKTLYVGDKTYKPEFSNVSTKAKITYKSSNSKVAKVSTKGTITPVKKGSATITATIKQNNKSYNLKLVVTVKNPYVGFTKKTENLNIGENFGFQAKAYGLKDKVTWKISDENIASISEKGIIRAKSTGTVTVTAISGNKTAKCNVNIGKKLLSATDINDKCAKSTVEVAATTMVGVSQGTGFFIESNIIVTNYHVIAAAHKIQVITYDNKTFDVVEILGYDEDLDLAILTIKGDYPELMINQEEALVGEDIYALGSPFGLTQTLSKGIVTTAKRNIAGIDYIQFDAAISPGNSGGPLINSYGQVIGVITMYLKDGQNINFAVNIKELNKVSRNHPMSVEDYYNSFMEEQKKKFKENMISEDTTVSQDPWECQEAPSLVGVKGNIHDNEKGDCYWFELKEAGIVYGLIELENKEDVKKVSFDLYNYNGDYLGSAIKSPENSAQIFYINLQPAYYFVSICFDDGYVGEPAPYSFVLAY